MLRPAKEGPVQSTRLKSAGKEAACKVSVGRFPVERLHQQGCYGVWSVGSWVWGAWEKKGSEEGRKEGCGLGETNGQHSGPILYFVY